MFFITFSGDKKFENKYLNHIQSWNIQVVEWKKRMIYKTPQSFSKNDFLKTNK